MPIYKIMLVDDEPFIVEGLKHLLDWDEYGIEVAQTAFNGLSAFDAFQYQRVDIIITDVKMPNLDGIELIKKVREIDAGTKFIVLSGYEDFEYVKKGIRLGIENYLLKPINEDELLETILNTIDKLEKENTEKIIKNRNINILKENVLNRWVTRRIGQHEFEERANLLGLKMQDGKYIFAAVRIIQPHIQDNKDGLISVSRHDALGLVEEVCRLHVPESMQNMIFCDYSDDIIIPFMVNDTDFTVKDVRIAVNNLLAGMKWQKAIIALGNPSTGMADVPEGYKSAKKMLFYSMFTGESVILEYASFMDRYRSEVLSYEIDIEPLMKLLLSGDRYRAFAFIGDLYERAVKQQTVTLAHLQDIAVELLYSLLNMANADFAESRLMERHPDGFFNMIYYMDRVEVLIDYVRHIAGEIMDCLAGCNAVNHPLVNRIIHYAQENYSENISLKTISHFFNTNTAYLGQLFRKETGEIFSNYLSRIRVEKAIHLLKTTNISANKISSRIGFSNPGYFYSVFKNTTGMSTIEYRQSLFK